MRAWIFLAALGGSEASGQDGFTRQVAEADGFFESGILPSDFAQYLDPTFGGSLKGDFGFRLSMGINYTSNRNLSTVNPEDDVYFNINPSMFYTSDPEGGARHVLSANYSPNPQFFREDSSNRNDRGSFNHNGGVGYRFNGSKLSVNAFLSLREDSGSDRFTNSYSEGAVASLGLRASYQLAPRTSIYSSLSSSYLRFSTAGQQDSDYVSTNFGLSWSATERLFFGPSLNYRWSDSNFSGSQTNLGLSFNVGYDATELIDLNASIGVQTVSYSRSGGNEDPRLTGSLGYSYKINPIWSWSGSISYANIPAPNDFGFFINDLSFGTGLSRALDVGSIGFSASYSISDYEPVGVRNQAAGGSDDYFSLGLRYGRPFFTDRISFSTGLSYSQSSGRNEWDKWTCSCSWGFSF